MTGKTLTAVQKGQQYETVALQFLQAHDLVLVTRNFHGQRGELDLVMRDDDVLVIVEVRYRKNNYYGGALESITATKQARIKRTTEYYMMKHNVKGAVRFDVVAITGTAEPVWLKNAF